MTTKYECQMAHNASNINHFEKNVLGERQYPHKSKHQHNTTKSQKLKKVVWTCRDNLQRTSTYERPFTREGNYLVLSVVTSINEHIVPFPPFFPMH